MTHTFTDPDKFKLLGPDIWQYPGSLSQPDDPYVTWVLRHPGNTRVGVTMPARVGQLSQAPLPLNEYDQSLDQRYNMTPLPAARTGTAEGYPWVVHLHARSLMEAPEWQWPWHDSSWDYQIPTQWIKGTAWFVRGVSDDDRAPIYLMTAAHNLVKKAPKHIDAWGRPMDSGVLSRGLKLSVQKSNGTLREGPYKGMYQSRARADAVLVVAELRPDPHTGRQYQRFVAWADMACIPQMYLLDPEGNRNDIAALRLHQPFPGDFPSSVLSNAPYIHSLPPNFTTLPDALFMGVGIPGFLDKYLERGGTYLLRALAHKDQDADPADHDTVFHFRPYGAIELRPLPDPGAPTDGKERFGGTLIHRLPQPRMPFGVSGGPGILGVRAGGNKVEMVICCMVIEDKDRSRGRTVSWWSGGAVFSSAGMTLDAADPGVLLSQLGATDLEWRAVTVNGQQYQRLSKR
ncbi:hypothetical protein NEMBOFW57_009054 [Staphylotrichum longicolle]|uniref:Uncharacterized protein n=1 Tax=Staphylotrichum longicolle TaxID=669026 RepID=A0AAD4HXV6_9PEZI|nr:hypothetical protein NEMBOFW57_009054 [Staphylotrichum longicolle]